MHIYRSHTCGALRASDVGQTIRLSGWVHRKRDHGGVLFIDLRDHYGLTQIVSNTGDPAFAVLDALRAAMPVDMAPQPVTPVASMPMSGASALPEAIAAPPSSTGALPVAPTQVASAANVLPTQAPVASIAVEPVNANLLLFTARAPTWVEVVERSGNVSFRKMLGAGESASANGALPLSVVIGRADGVDVMVRGKPFDLSQVAKANVARFEVK